MLNYGFIGYLLIAIVSGFIPLLIGIYAYGLGEKADMPKVVCILLGGSVAIIAMFLSTLIFSG